MSKHNDIYNILGKLAALEPAPVPAKQELKEKMTPFKTDLLTRLNTQFLAEKDMGKHNNATTGFKALAKKAGGGEKGEKIAGAQFQKMKKAGKFDEGVDLRKPGKSDEHYAAMGQKNPSQVPYKDPALQAKHDAMKKQVPTAKDEVDEDMLSPKQQKFANLAPPNDKITYADKIAGAKKNDVKEAEERTMSRAAKGYEKYGKEGMEALAKAGREGKDLDKVRDKYNKYDDDEKVNEGEYQDGPNKSDIPAFQRKAKAAPGDDSWKTSQQDLDDEASKSPTGAAGLAKAKERLGMNEEGMQMYDENDAHTSLPATRRVMDEEHSEYNAAAHTIRKWMRKRGWDTKSEMKTALKYIMDNLDDDHDDTLTPEVKEACHTCMKHRSAVIDEAGLDMNLLKGAQGGMQGVNTDPESERNRGKKYGYRNDRDDTGNDDDYDEHGNEKKGAKKSAPSDGPKTKGRPKKNFGPERTTANAYKHKGSRVAEGVNINSIVEDTIKELEDLIMLEADKPDFLDVDKDKNKKESFKKAVDDKKKSKESVTESVRHHPIYTDKEAWDHYKKEMDEEKLAVANGPDPLHSLAQLAGLGQQSQGHDHGETKCNMSSGGQMCPVHGMEECWSSGGLGMFESDDKADKDYDGDGEVESGAEEHAGSVDKAIKKSMGKDEVKENMSVLDNGQDEMSRLAEILKLAGMEHMISKFAGSDDHGHEEACPACGASPCGCDSVEEEYANTPDEEYGSLDAQLSQGNDLNKPKKMYKHNYKGGDNPMGSSDSLMGENVIKLEDRLARMYDSIKIQSK
jgi:hypothetical protein